MRSGSCTIRLVSSWSVVSDWLVRRFDNCVRGSSLGKISREDSNRCQSLLCELFIIYSGAKGLPSVFEPALLLFCAFSAQTLISIQIPTELPYDCRMLLYEFLCSNNVVRHSFVTPIIRDLFHIRQFSSTGLVVLQ